MYQIDNVQLRWSMKGWTYLLRDSLPIRLVTFSRCWARSSSGFSFKCFCISAESLSRYRVANGISLHLVSNNKKTKVQIIFEQLTIVEDFVNTFQHTAYINLYRTLWKHTALQVDARSIMLVVVNSPIHRPSLQEAQRGHTKSPKLANVHWT